MSASSRNRAVAAQHEEPGPGQHGGPGGPHRGQQVVGGGGPWAWGLWWAQGLQPPWPWVGQTSSLTASPAPRACRPGPATCTCSLEDRPPWWTLPGPGSLDSTLWRSQDIHQPRSCWPGPMTLVKSLRFSNQLSLLSTLFNIFEDYSKPVP